MADIKFLSKDELPKRTVNRKPQPEQVAVNEAIASIAEPLSGVEPGNAAEVRFDTKVVMKDDKAVINKCRRLVNLALEEAGLDEKFTVRTGDIEPEALSENQWAVSTWSVYLVVPFEDDAPAEKKPAKKAPAAKKAAAKK